MVQRTITRLLNLRENRICPECGHRMVRIRRTLGDRALSLVVPVIRCSCCGKSRLVLSVRKETRVASPL